MYTIVKREKDSKYTVLKDGTWYIDNIHFDELPNIQQFLSKIETKQLENKNGG